MRQAEQAVDEGRNIVILSDRKVSKDCIAIPALLATAAVHHYLIRKGLRTSVGLVVETGEAREVHHFACLAGYGAEAINPYLAFETMLEMHRSGEFPPEVSEYEAVSRYIKSIGKGLLKVASKMGISTYQSYCGAQIFDAVGLSSDFVEKYFRGTSAPIGGIGINEVAEETVKRPRTGVRPDPDLSPRARCRRRICAAHARRGPCLDRGHRARPAARRARQQRGSLPGIRQADQ